MDHLDILQNIALVYCVDDIMLIRLDEQEVAKTLQTVVQRVLRGLAGRRFGSHVSEVLVSRAFQDPSSEVKEKLSYNPW